MRMIAFVLALSMVLLSTGALANQSDLIWSTFLGGFSDDKGTDIAIGIDSTVYVTGYTQSTGFPVTVGAYDTIHISPGTDVFVSKFSSDGKELIYSTFLGGTHRSISAFSSSVARAYCGHRWPYSMASDEDGRPLRTMVDYPASLSSTGKPVAFCIGG